ncbi:MAG: pilin N-terminal domain-containing protein [Enterococcus sp.]
MKQKLLFVLLILVPLVGVLDSQLVKADTQPGVTVVLHKRLSLSEEPLPSYQNSGHEITLEDEASSLVDPQTSRGLSGVTFTVYEVSAYVQEQLQEKSSKEVAQAMMDASIADLQELMQTEGTLVGEYTTAEDGVISLSLPTKVAERDAAYLFLETGQPQLAAEMTLVPAAPLLLMLPVEDPGNPGKVLNTIHLYPKNSFVVKETEVIPPVTPVKPTTPVKPITSTPSKSSKYLPQTAEAKAAISLLGVVIVGASIFLWKKNQTKKN